MTWLWAKRRERSLEKVSGVSSLKTEAQKQMSLAFRSCVKFVWNHCNRFTTRLMTKHVSSMGQFSSTWLTKTGVQQTLKPATQIKCWFLSHFESALQLVPKNSNYFMKHIPIVEKVLINKLYHTECPYYKTEIQKNLIIQTGHGGCMPLC